LINLNPVFLKSSELHRLIKAKGWKHVRTAGSHYIYEKDGKSLTAPYHGSKEVPKGTEKSIRKQAGL
jgi:mRNA interferase HicA